MTAHSCSPKSLPTLHMGIRISQMSYWSRARLVLNWQTIGQLENSNFRVISRELMRYLELQSLKIDFVKEADIDERSTIPVALLAF